MFVDQWRFLVAPRRLRLHDLAVWRTVRQDCAINIDVTEVADVLRELLKVHDSGLEAERSHHLVSVFLEDCPLRLRFMSLHDFDLDALSRHFAHIGDGIPQIIRILLVHAID